MKALDTLRDLAKPAAIGPSPSFNEFHLFKALEMIIQRGSVGRTTLSTELGVGEGAVRTIIDHLQDAGIIQVEKTGSTITRKGQKLFHELTEKIGPRTRIQDISYAVGKYTYGILVKNVTHRVRLGIEQRDAAVKVGAIGAITMIIKDGRIIIPPSGNERFREEALSQETILKIFTPKDNDVIIICGADEEEKAENGTIAAAWTLL